jgi:hypothetical protein
LVGVVSGESELDSAIGFDGLSAAEAVVVGFVGEYLVAVVAEVGAVCFGDWKADAVVVFGEKVVGAVASAAVGAGVF